MYATATRGTPAGANASAERLMPDGSEERFRAAIPRTWEDLYDFLSDHWIEIHEYQDATLEVIRQAVRLREDEDEDEWIGKP
jgi:hypothetical protein